jgi:hypothetical protein
MVLIRHRDKRWTTDSPSSDFIEWLTTTVTEWASCCLIIDAYPAHVTLHVWQMAADNCLELLIVPVRAIGGPQLLYRRTFSEQIQGPGPNAAALP